MTVDHSLVTRRQALRGALAGAAAVFCRDAIADGESEGAPAGAGFIDAHAHVWNDDVEAYPLAGKFRAEDLVPRTFLPEPLLTLARKNGVGRIVLIQHQVYHGTDNRYMVDTLRRFPGLFSAVAYVDAAAPGITREMDRLKTSGVRGFRICAGDGGAAKWSDSDDMRRMWRHASETDLAMCPQIEPDYLPKLDQMCREFPDATVVVDHFAKIGTDGMIRESDMDALVRLARYKKAYAKLSAFYGIGDKTPPYDEVIPMIRRVYDAFGPERLMWASDCPYQLFGANTYEASISLVRDGVEFFTEEDKRQILRGTAERVFFG